MLINPKLIRPHILEQYHYRIGSALECFKLGACKACGCKTPDLFMANKGCESAAYTVKNRMKILNQEHICYGKMLSKIDWEKFKKQ
jgi:hypothetical protein